MALTVVIPNNTGCSTVVQTDAVGTTPVSGWVTSAAKTSSFNTAAIVGVSNFTAAFIQVDCTAVTGTTPTLNIYVQQLLPDGVTWCDIAAFTQITAATPRAMGIISAGDQEFLITDGSLTAGTFRSVPFGQQWRLKCTIAGTTPSFTFSVSAYFME